MHRYVIILRHACGLFHISTTASSAQQAINQVCEFEGAPHSAVMGVRDRGLVYKQGEI